MSATRDPVYGVLWNEDLEEVDREITRLALVCRVRILEPGAIARVLHGDTSVCENYNPLAFRMLREMLMLHLAIRDRAADAFGGVQAAAIEDRIIEGLRTAHPELGGPWPPN